MSDDLLLASESPWDVDHAVRASDFGRPELALGVRFRSGVPTAGNRHLLRSDSSLLASESPWGSFRFGLLASGVRYWLRASGFAIWMPDLGNRLLMSDNPLLVSESP